MKYIFLFICLLLPYVAVADDVAWQVNDRDSFIKFSVAIEGSPVEGEFTKFSADILFDRKNLDQARVNLTIDLDHMEASYSDVAENLKKKDWFDIARFPKARFVSRDFKHLEGDDYQVRGDLTLRDVTRSEILYFTLVEYGGQAAQIKGRMTVNRLDYGVGQGGWRDISTVAGQVFLEVFVKADK